MKTKTSFDAGRGGVWMRAFLSVAAAAMWAAAQCAEQRADALLPADEDALIAVLQSDAPRSQKADACQRLAVAGTAKAIPVLSGLLANAELSHMARYALEPMPDPAAGAALRGALDHVDGPLLEGVINSIGARRDRDAVPALSGLLRRPERTVVAAAAAALGRIGDAAAARALEGALGMIASDSLADVGDAGRRCIEGLMAAGDRGAAIRLADAVRGIEAMPWPITMAATRSAVLARGAEGGDLLLEQLGSQEWARHALGLRLVRELAGQDITRALVGFLPRLPAERVPATLAALADRGDRLAVPAVIKIAKAGPPEQRLAAIRALSRLGNAAVVRELAEIAAGGEEATAAAARSALVQADGPDVNETLLGLFDDTRPPIRALAAVVASEKIMASAVPALRKISEDPDMAVRLAAIRALGECGSSEEVGFLADGLIRAGGPQELNPALAALRAAISRIRDRAAISGELIAVLPKAGGQARVALVGLLGAAGGTNAFETVLAALNDPDAAVKDAAARALGEWGNPDAAADLLRLARELPDERGRILTLRGYIRLAEGPTLDDPQRSDMCQKAMAVAARDEERRLVLGVLGSLGNAGALDMALAHVQSGNLKNEAGLAVLGIAQCQARLWPDRRIPSGRIAEALDSVMAHCNDPQVLERARAKIGEIRPQKKISSAKAKG